MCYNEVRSLLNFTMWTFITLKKLLALLQQRWKKRDPLSQHNLLKYSIVSVSNKNLKQWKNCALWFFLFLSSIFHKKWRKNEFEIYQHFCIFSGKICPLHYHHHIKSGFNFFLAGILIAVRLVPYETLQSKCWYLWHRK